ncbi:uncharacterized protein LOC129743625 [Uranotaenia lowii]|uniref:uncharacterized protein LOC129743625 n=1 Tax=Uranotaenia lowii TaxID=190385 RepID=UPI002479A9FB|nr:uncharacterized protein LOC129743625 [Uranotaenia lowii]
MVQLSAAVLVILNLAIIFADNVTPPESKRNNTQLPRNWNETVIDDFHECLAKNGMTPEITDDDFENNREQLNCLTLCVLTKYGLTDTEGFLRHELVVQEIKKYFYGTEWRAPVQDSAAEQCLVDSMPRLPLPEGLCNPMALEFWICIWRKVYAVCQEWRWKISEQCDMIRTRCDSYFPKTCSRLKYIFK